MPKNLLLDSLERIRFWLERNAPHIAASLQPGISPQRIGEIFGSKADSFHIPEEVVALYQWRNGQAAGIPFFGVLIFQTFEEAVEYGNLAGEYFEGKFPLMIFQEVAYDAGYQARCDSQPRKKAPIYRWDHGDERIETSSLTDLITAVADGFEQGVFKLDSMGEFETNEEEWNAVLVKHHSNRTRSLNALMQHRWAELRKEELHEAFNDLIKTEPAQTSILIRSYIEAHPDVPFEDFETFFHLLSCSSVVRDEWTRDRAVKLISTKDIRVRDAVLGNLAWGWRGEIPFTEEVITLLIQQIEAGPLNDHTHRERAMLLGKSGVTRSIPALLRLLHETDTEYATRDTRIAAIKALETLQATEASELISAIAQYEPDPGTRNTAIRALQAMRGGDFPIEPLSRDKT